MLFCLSCSKWLDVKPYDKISEEELFSTEDGFLKHLNGIYIELNRDMLYGSALTVEMIEKGGKTVKKAIKQFFLTVLAIVGLIFLGIGFAIALPFDYIKYKRSLYYKKERRK